jgi:hypothetical protein
LETFVVALLKKKKKKKKKSKMCPSVFLFGRCKCRGGLPKCDSFSARMEWSYMTGKVISVECSFETTGRLKNRFHVTVQLNPIKRGDKMPQMGDQSVVRPLKYIRLTF